MISCESGTMFGVFDMISFNIWQVAYQMWVSLSCELIFKEITNPP